MKSRKPTAVNFFLAAEISEENKADRRHDPLHFDAAMETRSKRRKTAESIVDKIQRGEISIFVALAEELPDVFASEILPKFDAGATLNLAQVSKSYNDAVWSVDGVRSMEAKIKVYLQKIGKSTHGSTDVLGGKVRQLARGQGPSEGWGRDK